MPDNEIKTIKIGNKEFDKNEFGNFINNHLDDYLRYAKDKGGFSQDQANLLRDEIYKAYNSGDEFDVTGYSSTNPDDFKNIEITQNRFLRRDKKIEQGLTGKDSWLAHFISKAGQTMTPYEKPKDKNTWDFNTYNFGAYLKGRNQDAESMFSNYDKAPNNEAVDNKPFKERAKLTYDLLTNYRDSLLRINPNFDFTSNDNSWDDDYMDVLNETIDLLETTDEDGNLKFDENGDFSTKVAKIAQNLNYLGANLGGDYDYTRALTWDKYKYQSDEEKAKIAADKEAEAERKRLENIETTKRNWAQEFFNLGNTSPGNEIILNTFRNFGDFDNYYEWYFGTQKMNAEHLVKENKLSKNNLNSTFNDFTKFLRTGSGNYNYSDNDKKILLQLAFDSDQKDNIFLDLNDKNYYLINNTINDNGWGYAYNPTTGGLKPVFLGNYINIPEINTLYDELRKNYLQKYKDHEYFSEIFPSQAPQLKTGGLIKKYKWGDPIDFGSYEEDLRQRAKENNISVREQQEGERYLSEKNKSDDNSNAGLTYNDYWSLANAGANIASMLVDPVTGFWVGAASTTSEFINEIARDGFQWKDVGNLIKGYGMDAVGLLPVIGDKLGTLNKTKQILFKLVPGLIGTIGTISSAANTPQIIDSLAKIIDDRPMTVNDWRNIAEGINLVVTGANFGRGIVSTRKARNATDGSGALQIQVTDDLGNKKLLVVTGEDAAKIRTANKEKGLAGVNEEIHKLKSVEGAENYNAIVDNSKWNNYEWTEFSKENPETGGTDVVFPISRKQEKARIEVYRDPVEYSRVYRRKNPSQATINSYNKKYIGDTPDKVHTREQEKINKQANRIVRQNEAIKSIESKVQDRLDLEINNKQTIEESIKAYNRSKDRIKKEENELKYWEDYKTNHPNLPGLEKSNIERRNKLEKRKQRHQQKYKDDFETNTTKELNKLNKLIDALNKRKQDVEVAKHKDKFDIIRNFPKKEVTIFGKKYTFYPTEIKLPNENPYYISRDGDDISFMQFGKQGGSIDRNKLNKFLNYGKR